MAPCVASLQSSTIGVSARAGSAGL